MSSHKMAIVLAALLAGVALAWSAEGGDVPGRQGPNLQPPGDAPAKSGPPSAPATAPANSSKPVEKDGLSVVVTLSKATIATGKPLSFVVNFKNVSREALQLCDVAYFWDWTIQFEDVKAGGPWEVEKLFAVWRDLTTVVTILKPGETIEVPVAFDPAEELSQFVWKGAQLEKVAPIASLKPGRYGLILQINLRDNPRPGNATAGHYWVGKITTNPVELLVTDLAPDTQPE